MQDMKIEQALIGLALSDELCAQKIVELPEDTFVYSETRNLWQIIRDLVSKHQKPDLVTVTMRLKQPEQAPELNAAMQGIGLAISPAMYDQYETNALDLRRRRIMQAKCADVMNKVNDLSESTDHLAGVLMGAITESEPKSRSVSIHDAMLGYVDHLTEKTEPIMTGIAGLDRTVGGLKPGMMVVLGARPGVGKSALGLAMAANVAEKSGPVLIVSLEMSENEILDRIVANRSGVSMTKLTSRKLDDFEWGNVWGVSAELSKLPIRFSTANTPLQVRREAGSMLRNEGLKMIMIDYLQLMRADRKCNSRYEEVSEISREIKLMAMEFKVPVLALTQFNRTSAEGNTKPSMAEARDSGSIEQDANIFLVQYAPSSVRPDSELFDYYAACERKGTKFQIVDVQKNRQGAKGCIPLEFNEPLMRFTTMVKE